MLNQSNHFKTLINTQFKFAVEHEPFYIEIGNRFADIVDADLVDAWNTLSARAVPKIFGVFAPLDMSNLQFEIVRKIVAQGLAIESLGSNYETFGNDILDSFIQKISEFEPLVTTSTQSGYGYYLAAQLFTSSRDVNFCLYKSMELIYPSFSAMNRLDLDANSSRFISPLPFSRLYKVVKDSTGFPGTVREPDLREAKFDPRQTVKQAEEIKQLEFSYKLAFETQINRLCNQAILTAAQTKFDFIVKEFFRIYNVAISKGFYFLALQQGIVTINTENVEDIYHSALMVFAHSEVVKMKSSYDTGDNYFGSIEIFNEKLQEIRDSYVYLGTNADINEKQKDLEEDVAYKIGAFYLSLEPLAKDTSLIIANRNIGDLLRYWKINQENKQEVEVEIIDQESLNEKDLLAERDAQNTEETEEQFFDAYEVKRRKVFASEYADLATKLESDFLAIRERIKQAKLLQMQNIEKRILTEEALKKIKHEKLFQAEIERIREVIQ